MAIYTMMETEIKESANDFTKEFKREIYIKIDSDN